MQTADIINSAIVASNEGRDVPALVLYTQAHRLEPNNIKAINGLGIASVALKQNERALEYYRQAFANAAPDSEAATIAQNGMGIVYTNLKQWDEAKTAYHASLKIQPNVQAMIGLGYLAEREGNPIARAYYQTAAKLDPQNAYVKTCLERVSTPRQDIAR